MLEPLLIEITLEELPAIPFLKELENLTPKWERILEEYKLLSNFEIFYTPRRLVIYHREFLKSQSDSKEELFGAPTSIAIKDGEPTNAGIGFAKKCGVDFSEIKRVTKDGKEVLYFEREIKGRESKLLLEEMINKFLKSLHFGKSMRWVDKEIEFIRPIRNAIIILGNEILELEIFRVKSSNRLYPHRQISYEPILVDSVVSYFKALENGGVILYPDRREARILEQFRELESKHSIKIEIDKELLSEVVAITEYPTALIGTFEAEFLEIPSEVIITSMKSNQRYFAVYKDGKLTNKFVVVSNANTKDYSLIVKGNEKVLRARLSDALFFYKNDLKNGFNIEGLKNLVFVENLGTLYDKVQRERVIAELLSENYKDRLEDNQDEVLKAVELSKADLLTEMVYEFTELQGTIGRYYAKKFGHSDLVAAALEEQYLPKGESSSLPSNYFSSILAIANKLDNILALFSVGKIPSGTKDPFALRRSAIGIVKIVIDKELNFDIRDVISKLSNRYSGLDIDLVEEFLLDRIYQIFQDVNPSIVKAVINSLDRDILEISKKIQALNQIAQSENFKDIVSTFKRVANITKDMDMNLDITIDESLFESEFESILFTKFKELESKTFVNYEDELDEKFALKESLDRFFDNVLVNSENEAIKLNRKNLILAIYKSFKRVADIKEISY